MGKLMTPLVSADSRLSCIDGDDLSSDDPISAVYALILRVDPETGTTVFGVINEMPGEDIAVIGGLVAAASKARTGRVAIDSIQIVYEFFSRTGGTPEQRRREWQTIIGEK